MITSSSYSGNGSLRDTATGGYETHDDMLELGRLLCSWNSTQKLTISGYCSQPRVLDSTIFPHNTLPSYRLTSLELRSLALPDSSLLELVGQNCSGTLKVLKLQCITDLTQDVLGDLLKVLGPTLEVFMMTGGAAENDERDSFDTAVLRPLKMLHTLVLSSDHFPETVLGVAVSLPSIRTVKIVKEHFSLNTAVASVSGASPSLELLELNLWEVGAVFWDPMQRWLISKCFYLKEIEFTLNGDNFEDIEDGKLAQPPADRAQSDSSPASPLYRMVGY